MPIRGSSSQVVHPDTACASRTVDSRQFWLGAIFVTERPLDTVHIRMLRHVAAVVSSQLSRWAFAVFVTVHVGV
jgi:hypothetical protein